jgi:ribonucleoside-diphosphate reductase alpha chain
MTHERLPPTRQSVTHKAYVGAVEFYIIVGLYDDGRVGELFVKSTKTGSTLQGFLDCWCRAVSVGLQRGLTIPELVSQYEHMRFEPYGVTSDANIKEADSIPDYVVRWIELMFVTQPKRPSQC